MQLICDFKCKGEQIIQKVMRKYKKEQRQDKENFITSLEIFFFFVNSYFDMKLNPHPLLKCQTMSIVSFT